MTLVCFGTRPSEFYPLRQGEQVFENRLCEGFQVVHVLLRGFVSFVSAFVTKQAHVMRPVLESGRQGILIGKLVNARFHHARNCRIKDLEPDVQRFPITHRRKIKLSPPAAVASLLEHSAYCLWHMIWRTIFCSYREQFIDAESKILYNVEALPGNVMVHLRRLVHLCDKYRCHRKRTRWTLCMRDTCACSCLTTMYYRHRYAV